MSDHQLEYQSVLDYIYRQNIAIVSPIAITCGLSVYAKTFAFDLKCSTNSLCIGQNIKPKMFSPYHSLR